MARLPRIAFYLCLPLVCLCGCKPFQRGSLSQIQTPLPAAEDLAQRASRLNTKELEVTKTSQLNMSDSSANASVSPNSTTETAAQPTSHQTDASGYCESCGVNHGASGAPSQFRFTQPLPQYQPVASPGGTAQREVPLTLPTSSEQTFSNAIRVTPLQPEESYRAQSKPAPKTAKPAPPPQPDDSPTETPAPKGTDPSTISVEANQILTPATQTSAVSPCPQPIAKTELESSSSAKSDSSVTDSTPSLIATTSVPNTSARAAANGLDSKSTTEKADSDSAATEVSELSATLSNLRGLIANTESLDPAAEFTAELTALELLIDRVKQLAASESEPTEAQSLCEHQLQALVATLRPEALDISRPEGRQVAARTLDHLREAISQLEKLVSLKISHGTLCTEVRGFGQYKPFSSTEFRVGQPVLLYCEIENFCSVEEKSQSDSSDYRTRLKSSLVICREDGTVAQQAEFPVVEDVARNRRRDFYLYVPFTVGDLSPGKYRAHLMVDDLQGRKQAVLDPPVEFSVR